MSVAASISRRSLRFCLFIFAPNMMSSASADVKRSSPYATGKPVTDSSQAPNARHSFAFGPSCPFKPMAKPTTMPLTPCVWTSDARYTASRSNVFRVYVSSGLATFRSGSVIARPMRTVP